MSFIALNFTDRINFEIRYLTPQKCKKGANTYKFLIYTCIIYFKTFFMITSFCVLNITKTRSFMVINMNNVRYLLRTQPEPLNTRKMSMCKCVYIAIHVLRANYC